MFKVSIGEAGDTTLAGGGRTQVVGKFIQGGGAGDYIVGVRYVGPFGVNSKEDREYTHIVPETGNREEREAIMRCDMGNAGVGRRTRGGWSPV